MIIDENMKEVLHQAQNMLCLNHGVSPMIFMRIKNNKNLIIENIEMDTLPESINSFSKIKKKIENGELEEYIFIFDDRFEESWILIVIKANVKKEIQCECKVWVENGVYNFSEWSFYDNSNALGKKGFINNLFGQVFCNFN